MKLWFDRCRDSVSARYRELARIPVFHRRTENCQISDAYRGMKDEGWSACEDSGQVPDGPSMD